MKILENVDIKSEHQKGRFLADTKSKIRVKNAVPGDNVDIQLFRGRKYKEGNVVKTNKESEIRTEPFCQHFGVCGGCRWQNINYKEQLALKQKEIVSYFRDIFPEEDINEIIANDSIQYYRNKLDFTFSSKRWFTEEEPQVENNRDGLGFHVEGRFDRVADIEKCYLQEEPSNEIRLAIRDFARDQGMPFYDYKDNKGLLRALIIRTTQTQETMITLVVSSEDISTFLPLLEFIKERFPNIASLNYIVNTRMNNSYHGLDVKLFYGKDHIIDTLGNLKFRIKAESFFQTNNQQCLKLYQKILDFAELEGTETVYDLYSGVGTITLLLAQYAKKVTGIECVVSAVEDAKSNALLNNINNVNFVVGDMNVVFDDDFPLHHGYPDIVVTDPAREGMRSKNTAQLLKLHPNKIIYVSCNPKTQLEDIKTLTTKYDIVKVQPVDMFPHTPHIENIVLLKSRYK